jgi:hypothetical protein
MDIDGSCRYASPKGVKGKGLNMNDIVPRDEVHNSGVRAVGGIGGGVAVWIVEGILGGLMGLMAKIPFLGWLFHIAGGLIGGVLGLVGLGLVGWGGYNLFKFIKGLKSRA